MPRRPPRGQLKRQIRKKTHGNIQVQVVAKIRKSERSNPAAGSQQRRRSRRSREKSWSQVGMEPHTTYHTSKHIMELEAPEGQKDNGTPLGSYPEVLKKKLDSLQSWGMWKVKLDFWQSWTVCGGC